MAHLTDQKGDYPILGLHVMSFEDATVVILNYNHVLMDGGGSKAFLKAWTNVVNGRQGNVVPLAATEDDMIAGWVAKTVAGFLPATRPINLMRVYDLRRVLTKAGILEPETAHVQKMYQVAWTLTPEAKHLARAPLARLDSGMTSLYRDPKGMIFTANSRVKNHDCRKIDFSGAVKRTCAADGEGNAVEEERLLGAGMRDYVEALVQLPDMGQPNVR
ncbi:hypothetical protein INS49_014029 [Diaporthe citri]|uniref:uncharacterized protein n=1 Tax=Diaporthe citri TaxID=83186 RepID=UPI001C80AF6B|nr:uncharacterized protein INS49_014029 [Diaporthe citri]KAG6358145.1 hypothetical protein INS49_014029 [Diaporthe citri]